MNVGPLPLRLPRVDWTRVALRWLPFADAASPGLPLPRLLRLALFQVSVGMVTALTVGTLNRVMIVEIGVGAWLVAAMVALPLLVAPFRALIGLKSDDHRSALGWRRVPFVWFGTLLQFGGLAIMPFAIVLLGGETAVQLGAGYAAASLAFVLAGAGAQVVQTAGLALATDLADDATRPRVVALMYVMLLAGMVVSGTAFAALLAGYTPTRLVQVVQGAAVLTVLLNAVAMWKQEPRDRTRAAARATAPPPEPFARRWARFAAGGRVHRFLLATGLATAAFNMQDVILEPYGGQVLGMAVGQTSLLTGLSALGALAAFALAARRLARGAEPLRLVAGGVLAGLGAFAAVLLAWPLESPELFRAGAVAIGFGGGLCSVGTLCAAMAHGRRDLNGMVIGAWGGVVATATGLSVALGGALRDGVHALAATGALGEVMAPAGASYGVVYALELALLFVTLVVLGPLVRHRAPLVPGSADGDATAPAPARLGLAELPT